jgi:uncharacterized membrane protein HdeD (DUF308 family)
MLLISPSRWWLLLVESSCFVAFGVVSLCTPLTMLALENTLFFAILAFLALVVAVRERRRLVQWWLNLVIVANNFFLALVSGGYLLWGGGRIDGGFLFLLIGIQALVQGSISVAISLDQHHETHVRGFSVLYSLFSGIFGVLILANPYLSIFPINYLISFYGGLCGLALIPGTIKLRNMV